jgi:hypothetical protein
MYVQKRVGQRSCPSSCTMILVTGHYRMQDTYRAWITSLTEAWLGKSFLFPSYGGIRWMLAEIYNRIWGFTTSKGTPPRLGCPSSWCNSNWAVSNFFGYSPMLSVIRRDDTSDEHTSAESTTNLVRYVSRARRVDAMRNTHTIASAPLQYLSHMERNLGCPWNSNVQNVDSVK